MSVSCTVSEI